MPLPRYERRALLVAAVVLAAIALVTWLVLWRGGGAETAPDDELSQADRERIALMQREMEAKQGLRRERKGGDRGLTPFPFDPNNDDSLTLSALGLRDWQVSNILRYRRKGGVWRSPEHFARLYGLSQQDYEKLRPYIRIAPEDRGGRRDDGSWPSGVPRGERPAFEHIDKLAEGEHLSLNGADTTALKRIPGIGSYYARKIVTYRERMGGFVSVSQIDEIEGLPPGTSRWFRLEGLPEVRRIRINHASFKELVRHPYLSYEQTKDIVNHIRHYGPLRSWQDLSLYKEFAPSDFRRLAPYFRFD